jgi:uncharacterized protein YndB with AHSA1/START domain
MKRIILALGGAAVLAAVVVGIRRRTKPAAPARPLLLSENVTIERPPEEVFAYVSDPENLPEWSGIMREVRKEAEGPPKQGDHYTAVVKFLGRRFEQSFEVAAHEPPRRHTERSAGPPFAREHTYTFHEVAGGGTLLSVAMEMQPGGFFGLARPFLEKAAQRQARKELETLKGMLQSRG